MAKAVFRFKAIRLHAATTTAMLVKDKINKNFCIATIILKKNQKARHIFYGRTDG